MGQLQFLVGHTLPLRRGAKMADLRNVLLIDNDPGHPGARRWCQLLDRSDDCRTQLIVPNIAASRSEPTRDHDAPRSRNRACTLH